MNVKNYVVSTVDSIVKVIDDTYILDIQSKMAIVGEMSFMLGNNECVGDEQSFFVKYSGEYVLSSHEEDIYVFIITVKKICSALVVDVIDN